MIPRMVQKIQWWQAAVLFVTLTSAMSASLTDVSLDDSVNELVGKYVLRAGDPSLAIWTLPPSPGLGVDEAKADALTQLGRTLFFDRRLSDSRDRSCASCHRPELGWSDGLPTAEGTKGQPLARATPTLFNVAYGTIFTWDGRKASLEDHAMAPVFNPDEMGIEPEELFERLRSDTYYRRTFAKLFPDDPINEATVASAIAAFQKTLVSRNSRFDQWVAGDTHALTPSEIRGFAVFLDPNRGNCSTCHAPPNFTDDGFHNIGLESFADENPDLGRYEIRAVKLMRGAFKTPTIRNIALTAPYFHDGSARSLDDVVEHYVGGGEVKDNLSPEMKDISLEPREKSDLTAFLRALTGTSYELQKTDSLNLASDDEQ